MRNYITKMVAIFFVLKCQSFKELSPVNDCQIYLDKKTRSLMNLGLIDQDWKQMHKNKYFSCLVDAMAQAHLSIENAINGCAPKDKNCHQKVALNFASELRIINYVKAYITKHYAGKNGKPVDSFINTLYSSKYNICRPYSLDKGIAQGMICNNHALAAWQESKGSISHNCYEIYQPGTSTDNCKASADRIRLEYEWTDMLPSLKFKDKCAYLGKCPLHDFLKN